MKYQINLQKIISIRNSIKLKITCLLLMFLSLSVQNTFSETYYISSSGSATNPGTIDKPFGAIKDFSAVAQPGDTCFIRGGTIFRADADINIDGVNGTEDNPICLFAYPGETPVIDGSHITSPNPDTGIGPSYDGLIRMRTCNWWHIKGLTLANTGVPWTAGIELKNCTNMLVEECVFRNNSYSGFTIMGKAEHINVINCDSHHNDDPFTYDGYDTHGNADGYQVLVPKGNTNNSILYRGCRAWNNSDDGWDFFFAAANSVLMEDCWAFRNGYDDGGNNLGDGSGFKLGGNNNQYIETIGGHKLIRCIAWGNKWVGFNENAGNNPVPKADTLYNCSAYNNHGWAEYDFDAGKRYDVVHVLRNCFAYYTNGPAVEGSDNKFNEWNYTGGLKTTDFKSLDQTGMDGERQADGSLPESDFLRPTPDSYLIDKGEDLGYPFVGNAPDLGVFECSNPTAIFENQSDKVVFYPNPTTDKIFISNNSINSNYQVISLAGVVVKKGIVYTNEIDLSELNSGIYFIIVTDKSGEVKVGQVIKK